MEINNIELIECLNSLGYNLVLINDECFVFTEFIPAQDLIHKHRLVGKKIDGLTQNFSHVLNRLDGSTLRQLEQQLEKIPAVRREYSHYFEWITFLVK